MMLPARTVTSEPTLAQGTDLLAGQLTDSTIALYRGHVARYQEWCDSENRVPLDPVAFADYRDSLINNPSFYSPNYISNAMSAIKRTVKELARRERGYVARGLIKHELGSIFSGVPGPGQLALKGRLKPTTRLLITPEDMRAICDAPDKDDLIGARDAALLATLASAGGRNREIGTLTWTQITVRDGGYFLMLTGKKDIRPREAPLSEEAFHLIETWVLRRNQETNVQSSYIFTSFSTAGRIPSGEHLSSSGVWRIVRYYVKAAGLDHLEGVTPHSFRRFVGTSLSHGNLDHGRRALGHKKMQTFVDHYVVDELPPRLTDRLY